MAPDCPHRLLTTGSRSQCRTRLQPSWKAEEGSVSREASVRRIEEPDLDTFGQPFHHRNVKESSFCRHPEAPSRLAKPFSLGNASRIVVPEDPRQIDRSIGRNSRILPKKWSKHIPGRPFQFERTRFLEPIYLPVPTLGKSRKSSLLPCCRWHLAKNHAKCKHTTDASLD